MGKLEGIEGKKQGYEEKGRGNERTIDIGIIVDYSWSNIITPWSG